LTFLQQLLADEDAFTIFTLFFMQFSNSTVRFVYTVALLVWALLNIAEFGFQLLRKKRVPGLSLFQKYFCWAILNEIKIVQLKSHIEVGVTLVSPLLFFPMGMCAPLLPLIGLQVIRLKYVICEFTRETFNSID
jgi:hypothetical protein